MWDGRRANKDSSCNPIVSITKQIIKIRPSVITIIIIIVINRDRFMRGYRSFAFVCLTIRLHEAMGKDHDKAVHEWKSTFLPSIASNIQVTIIHIIST